MNKSILELAEQSGLNHIFNGSSEDDRKTLAALEKFAALVIDEYYANHPTKHDAARMARVRCLIEIGEQK